MQHDIHGRLKIQHILNRKFFKKISPLLFRQRKYFALEIYNCSTIIINDQIHTKNRFK